MFLPTNPHPPETKCVLFFMSFYSMYPDGSPKLLKAALGKTECLKSLLSTLYEKILT